VIRTPSPSHSVSLPSTQDLPAEEAMASDDGGSNELQSQQTGGIGSSETGLGESQFNGRLMYIFLKGGENPCPPLGLILMAHGYMFLVLVPVCFGFMGY
jgi:hypothetical protein